MEGEKMAYLPVCCTTHPGGGRRRAIEVYEPDPPALWASPEAVRSCRCLRDPEQHDAAISAGMRLMESRHPSSSWDSYLKVSCVGHAVAIESPVCCA